MNAEKRLEANRRQPAPLQRSPPGLRRHYIPLTHSEHRPYHPRLAVKSSHWFTVAAGCLAAVAACRSAPAPAPATAPSADAAPAAPAAMADMPAMTPAVVSAPAEKPDSARHGYTLADVRFMQHMIAHHAQALSMAAMVPSHTGRQDMHLLAERITVSQRDEIRMMERWLRDRGERVPDPSAPMAEMHHDMGHDMADHAAMHDSAMAAMPMMPGMLTPAQLDSLRAANGPGFDRLFLQDMIRHHEGALVMAQSLMDSPAAAQEPEIFRFASDVDADQRAEIARMQALLRAMPDQAR